MPLAVIGPNCIPACSPQAVSRILMMTLPVTRMCETALRLRLRPKSKFCLVLSRIPFVTKDELSFRSESQAF